MNNIAKILQSSALALLLCNCEVQNLGRGRYVIRGNLDRLNGSSSQSSSPRTKVATVHGSAVADVPLPTPTNSRLAGSDWRVRPEAVFWSDFDMSLNTDGTITIHEKNSATTYSGRWQQDGSRVVWSSPIGFKFEGILEGETLSGTLRNKVNQVTRCRCITGETKRLSKVATDKATAERYDMLARGITKIARDFQKASGPNSLSSQGIMKCAHCRDGDVQYEYKGSITGWTKYGSKPCGYCNGTGWLKNGLPYRP